MKKKVLLTHGDIVKNVGNSFISTAVSSNGIISAGQHINGRLYGVQFHPEVDLTPSGNDIFLNFITKICKLSLKKFDRKSRKEMAIKKIREKIGSKIVLCLCSGGVDSTVMAALVRQSVTSDTQLFPVHIDTGLMRKNESRMVLESLANIGVHVFVKNAIDDFLNGKTYLFDKKTGEKTLSRKLCEETHSEIKRAIIGDVFMKIVEDIVSKKSGGFKDNKFILAQGTLRPDLIESASGIANGSNANASCIKTHHNDTHLVRALRDQGHVVEPLCDWHKDEVRDLGEKELGLPYELVWRHPFPGPGLAIRILCQLKPFETDRDEMILSKLFKISQNETNQKHGICLSLLGIRTVGVQGDGRTYSHCVAISLKKLKKGSELTRDTLNYLYILAKEIPMKIHEINRVIFVFDQSGPYCSLPIHCNTITPTLLTSQVIGILRECDDIVTRCFKKYNLIKKMSQVPVILFPSNFDRPIGFRSICIRPFITNDFMTGLPARIGVHIPYKCVQLILNTIFKTSFKISKIAFDLTPKPPGTTEWE